MFNEVFFYSLLQVTMYEFTKGFIRAGCETRSISKLGSTDLKTMLSFSFTVYIRKAKEPCVSYDLSITGGRIIRFIPFLRVYVLCEMR